MKRRELLTNLAVVAVAAVVGLTFCEIGIRFFVVPADYLSVQMVHDDILGAVPEQGSAGGGFDVWGFRNAEVPESADVVAIRAWLGVFPPRRGRRLQNRPHHHLTRRARNHNPHWHRHPQSPR